MKAISRILLISLLLLTQGSCATVQPGLTISDLAVTGAIEGENVTFSLSFVADVTQRDMPLVLIEGDVACLTDQLPAGAELSRSGKQLILTFHARGRQKVNLDFASLPTRDGDWRRTRFSIPSANTRRLTMLCDRDDLEVNFPGALKVDRQKNKEGKTEVIAYLGVGRDFEVWWKPQVQQLSGELVVACDANSIAIARVGALRLDSMFAYRVVQGAMSQISLALPAGLNITQVQGLDIREWRIDENAKKGRDLIVVLNRPQEDRYFLQIESELVLPEFPCKVELPVIRPLNVMRTSGFLKVGTDSAIKLIVNKAMGLTQVDQGAFPVVLLKPDSPRPQPSRSAFAYQYANMPYSLELSADDIVTAFNADEQLVLNLKDTDLALNASVDLDVRDAPAREIQIETDPQWTVANVSGGNVSDYDVREEQKRRIIHVFFRDAVLGRALVQVRLERSIGKDDTKFALPTFHVRDAKTERGFIVVSAEKGVQLKAESMDGLREVHTGSLPVRVPDAQLAYRFKAEGWNLALESETTTAAIYSELFHLVSAGEGALYGSCTITYHISGAPVRNLKLRIPESYQNVEIVGRDIRSREQIGNEWTLSLQEKILGDYTLLVSYDQPFRDEGDQVLLGGTETLGTESEVGYIVLAGPSSLHIDQELSTNSSLLRIDRAEIPESYSLLINSPVLRAYKYVQSPHSVQLALQRYSTDSLLSKVADYTALSSQIGDEGEVVTKALYFVKNTSDQYLGVTLPRQAKLWSASVDGSPVQALNTGKDQELLIPLPRHRDPNQPARVELVYAESFGKIGFLKQFRLTAPLTSAQSVFTKWMLTLPQNFVISHAGGNMIPDALPSTVGIQKVISNTLWTFAALVLNHTPWFFAALIAFAVLCRIAYNRGRGRRKFGAWAVVGIVGILAILILIDPFARGSIHPPLTSPSRDVSFTKTVNLADTVLNLDILLAPAQIGTSGSLLWLAVGCLVGVILIARALRHRKEAGGFLCALGLTAFTWGCSQTALTLHWISLVFVLVIPIIVLALALRFFLQAGRRYAAAHPDIDELPPSATGVGTATMLLLIGASFMIPHGAEAKGEAPDMMLPAPVPAPVQFIMDSVNIDITAPGIGKRDEKIARAKMEFRLTAKEAGSFVILSSESIVTEYKFSSDWLTLQPQNAAYIINVRRPGEYTGTITYLVGVSEINNSWQMSLGLPQSLKNKVLLHLPEKNLQVASGEAVLLKTAEKDVGSETTLVFGPAPVATVTWKPQERITKLEEALFFSEMNTLASFEPGVANLIHTIHYQIAQGEVQSFTLDIPEGTSVTAVRANGLSTWRYDPDTRLLEALLEKPVSGNFTLTVMTQIPQEGLPYKVTFSVPVVRGTSRQRGAIAVTSPDPVQVRVDETSGLNPMNIGDFPADSMPIPGAAQAQKPVTLKRAFRYHQLPVLVTAQAEQVTPEIRVNEEANLDISDERTVLSSRLNLSIAKAGVFSIRLQIPNDFDVDSLTGAEVSHWDEVRDDGHGVLVYFKNQVLGDLTVNLLLTRTEKKIEQSIVAPRVRVQDALKHYGTLAVSGEHGVRFMSLQRDGVSEINPKDIGISTPGYLAFRILRPDWTVTLKTEVVNALVKAEVLQRVDLSEGLIQNRCFIRYTIENAGIKSFQLQSPQPGITLTVSGRDIAKVQEINKTNGLWQIDLNNKVIDSYALNVSFQSPATRNQRETNIQPLKTIGTDSQKGYLVVFSGGHQQVSPISVSEGLRAEDARSIPAVFSAGDLSSAILCYRSTKPDYSLSVSVVRHESADMLPATVKNVALTSVVSEDNQMITRVVMNLQVGDLRFLKTQIPADSRIWTLFVNGRPVVPLKEKDDLLLPLDPAGPAETASIEMIYSGGSSEGWFMNKRRFEGPRFDLPLENIVWSFYLPPGYGYHGFDGTLKPMQPTVPAGFVTFDTSRYTANAELEVAHKLRMAEDVLKQGEAYARMGRQREAKKAFESALYYSQSKADFNEDARIQYRNLAKQQAVVGLVNRRDSLKAAQNLQQEVNAPAAAAGAQQGQWTAEYGQQVQRGLTADDSDALNIVAEKIIDQQAAAAGIVPAIQVTLPSQGFELSFRRDVQIQPLSAMFVTCKTSAGLITRNILSLLFAGLFLALYWTGYRGLLRNREAKP